MGSKILYLQIVVSYIVYHAQLNCFITVYPVELVYLKKSLDFGKSGMIKTSYVDDGQEFLVTGHTIYCIPKKF